MCNAMCLDLLGEVERDGTYLMLQSQGEVARGITHFGGPVASTCAGPEGPLSQGGHTLNLEGQLSRKQRKAQGAVM